MRSHDEAEKAVRRERILVAAWPGGVPAAERALLMTLSDVPREIVLDRLDALCRAEAGGADLGALMKLADMGRTGFYELRKRWEDKRTVSVLVPNAKRRAKPGGVERPKAALAVRQAPPDRTPSALAADLREVADASVPTLRRLVRRERRKAATTPDALLEKFGSAFALDQTALDLPITSDPGFEWPLGCFLLERASGLILSATVERMRWSSEAVAATLNAAVRYAEDHSVRVSSGADGGPRMDVVLGDQGGPGFFQQDARMPEVLGAERVHADRPYRFARFLLEAVGSGVDGIHFRPRTRAYRAQVAPEFLQRREAIPLPDAHALLDRAVKRHNAPIEKALRSLSLIEADGDPGPLVRLISSFR